ncbi:MAG: histidinol-phosphate transaminase [Bradymonadaceae bacterium]|nr:histidinol-phosphate transaminase [Lujinxingiaceae bacterium]
MKPLVDTHIATLKPYVPGKPIEELERELGVSGSIKLASNENPLGPSPKALEAVARHMSELHIYPDGAAFKLKASLAAFHGVDPCEITTGNGSNELLTLAVRTFCRSYHDHAVTSECAFAAYQIILQSHNVAMSVVPMTPALAYDLGALQAAITEQTKLVFVANPNNPTGTYVTAEALRRFLREVPPDVVVVVDEAYHEYVTAEDYASAETMRAERERLLIVRTFSKCYGLAGLRVGYMIGTPEMIDMVNRVREPFNCNLLAQRAACAALEDHDFLRRTVELNTEGRRLMEARLASMAHLGVSWIPSQTNFLLVRTQRDGRLLYERLLQKGVIVRPLGAVGPLACDLRVSIGTAEQIERFCAALLDVLVELSSPTE